MKIGLIGAENSHARHFCQVINGNHPWDDVAIDYIYGADDPAECARLCDEFQIAQCNDEDELIARSDAVVVTYRKGSEHYGPVLRALKAGKPVFNDKPFATDLAQAKEIAELAAQRGLLLCGGSSLKGLPELAGIRDSLVPGTTAIVTFGADPASRYDGYWFYGIHAVEVCLTLFGLDFVSVQSFRNSDVVVTNVAYSDRLCVLTTAPHLSDLMISVSAAGRTACHAIPLNYQSAGPEEFVNMIKSGKPPRGYEFYVKAVELTESIVQTAGLQ